MADVDGSVSRVRVEDEEATCLKDITHVRITAIVKSDDRVTYEAEQGILPRRPHRAASPDG